ncbi:MAG: Stp1/IreP family PP2C-type Ser/Thr phosphatase [Candidatus Zixiibacteriota bacterium]
MSGSHQVTGKSHRGLVRPSNEDYLHLDENHAVYAVCDGMGGHQAGEIASMTASETIQTVFDHFQQELLAASDLSLGQTLTQKGDLLVKAIRLANRAIYTRAATDPALAGMGTTVVAAAIEGDMMSIAHVGDSRAYRLEEKRLVPLTSDHSWVSEMQQNGLIAKEDVLSMVGKNVITRALGVRENIEIDYRLIKIKPGDIFVLCSDGLCGFADDDEIFAVARKVRKNLNRMVDDLIQLANDRGGSDNVTVIAIEVGEVAPSQTEEMEVVTLPAEPPDLLQVEDQWLTKIDALKTTESTSKLKSPSGNPTSKLLLTIIFAVFIILAGVLIYFSTGK